MKTYQDSDFEQKMKIESQSDNFILLHDKTGVIQLYDMEYLLSIGLECCDVSPSLGSTLMICCRKKI